MNVPAALVLIAFLTLVVIHYRRQDILEARRRERAQASRAPKCQVIGCDNRPASRWMPHEGVYACDRCAEELDALRPGAHLTCAFAGCPSPVVTVVHGWPLCAGHVEQRGGVVA